MKENNNLLRERRLELGLTMLEVAQRVGVSEGTVSRWESGNIANMRRDKIVALANALDITPAAIMGWDDEGSKNLFKPSLMPHEIQVLFAYRAHPEMQPAVDRLLGVTDGDTITVYTAAQSEENHPDQFVKKESEFNTKLENMPESNNPLI